MDTLDAYYLPGRLQIKQEVDLQKVASSLKRVILTFSYNDYYRKDFKQYSYRFKLSSEALYRAFNIIEIYNLDKKYNRLHFVYNKGDDYVFDYYYPGAGALAKRRSQSQ